MAEQTGGGSGAKFPRYCTVADRLQTFGNWPSSNHQQPRDLAEAGFFYEGFEDRVKCYSCGEELSRWTPEDDPWVEHEKFQPRCEHVLQQRMGGMNLGSSDVDEVTQGQQHSENDPKKEEKNTSRQRAHETVEEELQRLRYQFACKTCFKEKACMVILPCCHLSACVICVEKLEDCNVCHQHITATVKAYCA